MAFITQFVIVSAITLVSTVPVKLVSAKVQRRHNTKKWTLAALVIASISALLDWGSRRMRDACELELEEACPDVGGAGTQFLLIGGFVFWALLSAYLRYNDY